MEQTAPRYWVPCEVDPAASTERIAASLGLATTGLDREHPPVVCSTGNRFLLVKLREGARLTSFVPDAAAIASVGEAGIEKLFVGGRARAGGLLRVPLA